MKEITEIARGTASDGNIVANLIDGTAAAPTTIISNEAELNTLVNSNRVFFNSLAAITDLDC